MDDFGFDRIYQPEGAMSFSCEETDWRYLTDDDQMPAQMQHIPTSLVFQVDMDIPDGAETFHPLRCIYAIPIHQCADEEMPDLGKVYRIAREGLTLWLIGAGYLDVTSHVDKA